jgi:putative flavoprotein involved in K+ transport
MERVDVAVVGGGQAGLAVSHELTKAGVEHLVLERGRVARPGVAAGTASAW